eukprot:668247-Rhodomonas_salina.1
MTRDDAAGHLASDALSQGGTVAGASRVSAEPRQAARMGSDSEQDASFSRAFAWWIGGTETDAGQRLGPQSTPPSVCSVRPDRSHLHGRSLSTKSPHPAIWNSGV